MKSTQFLTYAPLLASTAIAALNDFDLHAVLAPGYDTANLDNIVPSTNVTLDYSLDALADPRNSVSIELQTYEPVVLLEAIGSVARVACTYNTVTIGFSTPAAFQRALSEWPHDGQFWLITNHLGQCDTAGERGIYLVAALNWDKDHKAVSAQTVKLDFRSIASTIAVTFSDIQGSMTNNSGNITWDEPGINVASNFSLPTDEDILSEPPYFTATAKNGYLSDATVIRGHLSYDVPSQQLQSLWFDIDSAFFGDLAVTFNVTAPFSSNRYSFSPGTFFASAVNVPGAFSLQPALLWTVGADVGTDGAIHHNSNITMSIPDGHAHIDFVNSTNSHIVGWGPRLTSAVQTDEAATGHASPFVDFSIELALDVLDGLFNTTGGIAATPQFVNDLNVAQSQTRIRKANQMFWPRNITCVNGFELRSSFNFSVDAYVTGAWQNTLYSTEIPISDECYPF
ncbi:hypothetical protein F4821DRAFT_277122 [Hypoxylon rubiginosum]|uniref:Uncharacterized protein n=1 Tax=Hypoxylon rubiginosum TaxID=110542 RepID=A0ACC0D7E4_9PEZI|nr:hypothetical protein F4821DRAFT_277122 [Hypoxylon rubiginosum]